MDWIEAIVLGAVQGVTEFLPISSDGHLNLAQELFAAATGRRRSKEEALFFFVMLHVGTTVAILAHYRAQIVAGARGLLGSADVADDFRRPSVLRVGTLAVVATLPLVVDVLVKKRIEATFDDIRFTAAGFLVSAAMLAIASRLRGGEKGSARTTYLDALVVGLAQMLAPLPGVSRSGLTVVAALAAGLSRTWAVGFSLMLGVVAITGATIVEIKDVDRSALTPERVAQTFAGVVVAGVVGFVAITWLVRVVRSGRLWYFSVYLVLLAAALFAASGRLGGERGGDHAGGTTAALDRAVGAGPAGPGDARGVGGALDRPLPAGLGPRLSGPGEGG